ncbi:NAD-dependent epimerase/dehydratase family protein [Candidatus Liberibacter solanacearum]|uniref:NAD(P)-dependent oxidoreductase n=1 Tax=Candidatus Liberibacter solanacearum TaxID=556287 RepID=A0A1V2N8G5_9HYPH|nr:NAD-dependent epimerase/dehydratase family protein [Candidatus Liberibacter solanacearum]ONI59752.1 NAD(P)-dependent oxidoreductase [Candidatus Liberibacter solanacearum]ONI59982.1 NAD(P)-dependent oxidoreductase [Candidatus Liberibacter solanacearum]
MHLMIFGSGYAGQFIADVALKIGIHTSGTTRSESNLQTLKKKGISAFLFANQKINNTLQKKLYSITHVVQCIKPEFESDPCILSMGEELYKFIPNIKWIGYLSSTSVYGNRAGQWVDEQTPIHPISYTATQRFEVEKKWISIAKKLDIKVAILRLSGIYGPKRNPLITIKQKNAVRLIKKDQVFNRIRVEDIAQCVIFLMKNNLGGIFNVSDDEPSPPQNVIIEAASLMKVNPPLEQYFDIAKVSPITRLFYADNKRISNAKIKSLGFRLLYPNYRISLKQLWEDHKNI